VAQTFYVPLVTAMIAAGGANLFAAIPDTVERQVGGGTPPDTKHVMGGMQMSFPGDRRHRSERTSASAEQRLCCRRQRVRHLRLPEPHQTLMAVALPTARGLTGRR
jgi:hypothetical protein